MEYSGVFMILADPTRIKILELLVHRNYCVGALAGLLGISASAVSQHLKILQNAGLVNGEKAGYHTHYLVNRELLHRLAAEIDLLANASSEPCEKRGARCGEEGMRQCMRMGMHSEEGCPRQEGNCSRGKCGCQRPDKNA